jgi:polyferredoxin
MYFLTFFASPWVGFFEHGEYVWVAVTASIAILIIAAAFFITRFWCRYFCPVGTIAELSFRLKRLLKIGKSKTI